MRRAVLLTGAGVLLVGPTVLAFFSGGYFDEPRLIATLVAWAVVLVVAFAAPRPLPASVSGRVALAGLALIAAWTGGSVGWAPVSGPAIDNLIRLLLFVGAFVSAIALVRDRLVGRAVEPALALGAVVVICYGLAGRLLPGVVHLSRSATAGNRLEQPITYWNAEGALAAMGLVLCARLAGTASRPAAVRVLAAAAAAPLGLGVYLSFSRGAIAAAAIGLIVVLAAAPSWSQLRAAGTVVGAGVIAAASSTAFPGVESLVGTVARRERDGAIMLAIVVAVMAAAAFAQAWLGAAEGKGHVPTGRLRGASRLPAVAAAAVCLGLTGLVVGGLGEKGRADQLSRRHGASRLTTIESRRYDYWRLGVKAFARHPLKGVGAGGFRAVWFKERPVLEAAREVHSLPLEMATELGLPGLLAFAMFLGGVLVAGRRALRRNPTFAAGACAAGTVWLSHAAIDWDWEVPAVTLPALVLAGALVAAGEGDPEPALDGMAAADARRASPTPPTHARTGFSGS